MLKGKNLYNKHKNKRKQFKKHEFKMKDGMKKKLFGFQFLADWFLMPSLHLALSTQKSNLDLVVCQMHNLTIFSYLTQWVRWNKLWILSFFWNCVGFFLNCNLRLFYNSFEKKRVFSLTDFIYNKRIYKFSIKLDYVWLIQKFYSIWFLFSLKIFCGYFFVLALSISKSHLHFALFH